MDYFVNKTPNCNTLIIGSSRDPVDKCSRPLCPIPVAISLFTGILDLIGQSSAYVTSPRQATAWRSGALLARTCTNSYRNGHFNKMININVQY